MISKTRASMRSRWESLSVRYTDGAIAGAAGSAAQLKARRVQKTVRVSRYLMWRNDREPGEPTIEGRSMSKSKTKSALGKPVAREPDGQSVTCCVCGKEFFQTAYGALCDMIITGEVDKPTCSMECYQKASS